MARSKRAFISLFYHGAGGEGTFLLPPREQAGAKPELEHPDEQSEVAQQRAIECDLVVSPRVFRPIGVGGMRCDDRREPGHHEYQERHDDTREDVVDGSERPTSLLI